MENSKLKNELTEGEQVLWSGKAEPFSLLTDKNKKSMMIRWLLSAAAFIILTVAYVLMVKNSAAGFSWVAEAVIVLIFGYIAIIPVMDRKKIIKKCEYYITDKRVIVVIGDKDFYALNRKSVKASFVNAGNGCVNALFGSYVTLPERKYRISAIIPGKDEKGENVTGIEFYNVKDDKKLRDFFLS